MSAARELSWRPTAHARRILMLAAFALLLGLGLGRPGVAALAAVPLAFLLPKPGRRPATAGVEVRSSAGTAFEGDPVTVSIHVDLPEHVDLVDIALRPGGLVEWDGRRLTATGVAGAVLAGELRVQRWGSRDLGTAAILLSTGGGLQSSLLEIPLGELPTFPQPFPVPRLAVSPLRRGMVGDHRARRPGAGAEFAGIRPYGPGDSPARVNWPISVRMQQLHVTQRLAEEGVEVVVVVDTFTDVGPRGRSTFDLALRGATGVAHALLRRQDRVGAVALGNRLRWVRPSTGTRHFYRIAAALVDVVDRQTYVDPDVNGIPPAAIPSGAHVVLFSPLLDRRALSVVEQLRMRGLSVTVVDVLTSRPRPTDAVAQLSLRLWLLDREATAEALHQLGVLVVPWDGVTSLDALLRPALTGRRPAVRR